MVTHSATEIEKQIRQWLQTVVIDLNLCPFAARPALENRVRVQVCEAPEEEAILQALEAELCYLDRHPASETETTLLVLSGGLRDFFDYNLFLDWADQLIRRNGWRGVYQIASFHPDYCFAGAADDDPENLTNRAPWPVLHLIREESLQKALDFYPDVEAVPDNNRALMSRLTAGQQRQLFPWLFDASRRQ